MHAARSIDDAHCRTARSRGATSHPANFAKSSISTLSHFLNLSVATHAFLNRARIFFEIARLNFAHANVDRHEHIQGIPEWRSQRSAQRAGRRPLLRVHSTFSIPFWYEPARRRTVYLNGLTSFPAFRNHVRMCLKTSFSIASRPRRGPETTRRRRAAAPKCTSAKSMPIFRSGCSGSIAIRLNELVEDEFGAELDLCRANPEMLRQYLDMKRAGHRVGFISDTYWNSEQLGPAAPRMQSRTDMGFPLRVLRPRQQQERGSLREVSSGAGHRRGGLLSRRRQ